MRSLLVLLSVVCVASCKGEPVLAQTILPAASGITFTAIPPSDHTASMDYGQYRPRNFDPERETDFQVNGVIFQSSKFKLTSSTEYNVVHGDYQDYQILSHAAKFSLPLTTHLSFDVGASASYDVPLGPHKLPGHQNSAAIVYHLGNGFSADAGVASHYHSAIMFTFKWKG